MIEHANKPYRQRCRDYVFQRDQEHRNRHLLRIEITYKGASQTEVDKLVSMLANLVQPGKKDYGEQMIYELPPPEI